ncbi:MAG: hypothetical protein IMW96_12680, partial [Thermoanaerobacteraceae bacterium]|nr:hypothetical protein [Thermoanaerobacteraceae bacterium]
TDMLWEIQKRVAKAVGIDLPDRPDLAQLAGQGGSQAAGTATGAGARAGAGAAGTGASGAGMAAGPGAQPGSAPAAQAGQEDEAARVRSRLWIPGSPGTY